MNESKTFTESQWLEFKVTGKNPKTDIVTVYSKSDGSVLGQVRWYGHWRHYCFFPVKDDVVWSDRCLKDLADYVSYLNDVAKQARAFMKMHMEAYKTK